MENNKIIAISGQPVTGKGTTVKAIIDKLKKQGYSDEKIHVITTGHEFRDYFNAISEFIKSYRESENVESLSNNPYLKKFFEKREYREILIDTIVNLKQNNIDIDNLNIEQCNNLKEFSGLRKVIDTIIDTGIAEKGKEIKEMEPNGEIWIIDSRLAFHNIPEAFSVRLVSNPAVAGERLFNDKNRGEEDNKYESIEDAIKARESRRIGEQERYKKRYGVDLEDENNYDLIIDTSYSTPQDISETILTCLEYYTDKKYFAKYWTSPKLLLPLQNERETWGAGWNSSLTLEEITNKMKKEGYDPDCPIDAVEVDGCKYIIEGHHRNFAAARLQKTLVPYEIVGKDDEKIQGYTGTAKERAKFVSRENLWGHEQFFDNEGSMFSYNEVYPGIYDKLKERDETEGR